MFWSKFRHAPQTPKSKELQLCLTISRLVLSLCAYGSSYERGISTLPSPWSSQNNGSNIRNSLSNFKFFSLLTRSHSCSPNFVHIKFRAERKPHQILKSRKSPHCSLVFKMRSITIEASIQTKYILSGNNNNLSHSTIRPEQTACYTSYRKLYIRDLLTML